MITEPWSHPLRLAELVRAPRSLSLAPDAPTLKLIARELALPELRSFTAELDIKPWMDGIEIKGRWRADYQQTCGITLEPIEVKQDEAFLLRCVPAGSPAAPTETEAVVDPDADDPPDVIEDGVVDLGRYLVEQFALAVDPFPRKPGAVFEPPVETRPISPFAVLAQLKPPNK